MAQGKPQGSAHGGRKPGSGNRSGANRRKGAQGSQSQKQQRPSCTLGKPVFFVGFMGAGKTSVSRRLARMCHISSIDLDAYLERREDKRIKDIFAEAGEEGFRDLESRVLRELMTGDPQLVSCGGGIIKRPENRELLKQGGFVVYLKVSADEAQTRISDLSTRPLFSDIEAARKANAERLPMYEEVADAVIDTAGKSVGRIAGEVKDLLKKKGILWQSQE